MALTDTFVRQIKHSGAAAGDKHSDGQGLFVLVKAAGKYWRMSYRFAGKQKTLAFGVYPAVSLSKARKRRDAARELLADGVDPGQAKRDDKRARADAAAHTFELVARQWLTKTASKREASTQEKIITWLVRASAERSAHGSSKFISQAPKGRMPATAGPLKEFRWGFEWRIPAREQRPLRPHVHTLLQGLKALPGLP